MRLALDIGGTLVKCALISDEGRIKRSGEFPTSPSKTTREFADRLIDGAHSFLEKDGETIDLIGAGMAGFCDDARGVVFESPNLPGVKDLQLGAELSDGLGVRAYVENDATAAAWGEYLFGEHEGIRHMLVVTLGTGIGGGLVLDGRLYRGARGFAGEFGHVPYDPDGPDCPCGGKGCLERYVGREPFEQHYLALSGLTDVVEPKIIHERASRGDSAAREAWDMYGRRLGVALAGAANLLDLGAVILSGGIAGAWDDFRTALIESFERHLITPLKGRVELERSNLEGNAGLLGAAFLDRADENEDQSFKRR